MSSPMIKPILIRMRKKLHILIKKAAKEENTSLNRYINAVLEKEVKKGDREN